MSSEEKISFYEDRIGFIYKKNLAKLSKLNENFNALKDKLYYLTKIYEEKTRKDYADLRDLPKIDVENVEKGVKNMLENEREKSAKTIEEALLKYRDNNCLRLKDELGKFNTILSELKQEAESTTAALNSKVENLSLNRNNAISNMNIDLRKEMDELMKSIHNIYLDNLVSTADKAGAVQDILKIYLSKFKTSKNESGQLEDKIVEIILQLMDKILLMKNRGK